MEVPLAQAAPVVDRLDPAAGRLVFGPGLVVLVALDLQQDRRAARKAHQEIRLVVMADLQVFVGHHQAQVVVAGVELHQAVLSRLLDPERRRLLPRLGVGDHLVDVAVAGAETRPDGLEVDLRSRADGLVAVQHGQQRGGQTRTEFYRVL